MRVSRTFGYIRLLFVLVLLGMLFLWPSASQNSRGSDSDFISNYRSWTRVNDRPFTLDYKLAIQCSSPTAQQIKDLTESPHGHRFIVVYVNDVGTHAMLKEKNPHFPEGSIIVKEKLAAENSETPELLTVMVKREKGYNPENGDWEFMVLDGQGKNIQARGRLESCQACHQAEKDTDFVSRRYLNRVDFDH